MMLKEIKITINNSGIDMSMITKDSDPYDFPIEPEQIDKTCEELQEIKNMFYKKTESK